MLATALVCAAAPGVWAQDTQSAPAHVAIVDGAATLERDGQAQSAIPGLPVVAGDRLRTTRGRVEVLFPDGSALDVDEFTTVDVQSPTLIRLTAGRVMLIVAGASDPSNAVAYQIDTPPASAFTEGPGEYRVALFSGAGGGETELAVFRGTASLSNEQGSTRARAGERTLARDLSAPSYAVAFNSARFDAFDRWAMARRDARLGTQSAQYLPPSLSMYSGTFDRYGRWSYEPAYGYVWYPAVALDWRPYYLGYWSPISAYGWTWIGFDIWGWPTYHYGRWGHVRNRWFWIPGRHWAPAWVSWAVAPGYVGWCPLGFSGGPVFSLAVHAGNPWPGWTFVNSHHFGGPLYVAHHYAVTTIPATTPFIQQSRPPVAIPRPRAVPGGTTQSAGRAIPRQPPGATPPATPVENGIVSRQPATTGARQPLAALSAETRRTPIPTTGTPTYVLRPAPSSERSAPSRSAPPPVSSMPPRTAPPLDGAQRRPTFEMPSRSAPPPTSSMPPRTAPPPSPTYTMPSRTAPPFDGAQGRPSYSMPSRSAPPPPSAPPSYSMPSRSAPPPPSYMMPSRSAPPPPSAPPSYSMPSRSAPPPPPSMPSRSAPAPSDAAPPTFSRPQQNTPGIVAPRAMPAPSAPPAFGGAPPPPTAAPAAQPPAGARAPRSR